jgi:hypothetical protein
VPREVSVPLSVLADGILLLHLAFVVFVVLGGLLAVRWPRMAWLHLPAAIWGVAVEMFGWYCPLTPLENALRERAGGAAYDGDFIARYLLPVLYPEGLTRPAQIVLGAIALLLNVAVYTYVWRRRQSRLQ